MFEGGPDGEHKLKPGRGPNAKPTLEKLPEASIARLKASSPAKKKDAQDLKREEMQGKRASELGQVMNEAKFHEPTRMHGQLVKFGKAVKKEMEIKSIKIGKSKGLRANIKKPNLGIEDRS